ncbi:L-talarate/galactarate dehydratase [Streptomyces griseorubiginosus]|uniref:L-talarate/galactarate dehydratase n=1 Tax=Streptomyces griseorubiginosus TaxID=67304 RepID=A0AAI8KXH3_9ACTN|nr:L-talarate/galactarate dehydratase [Streptomyces griseorubiginosus]
MKLLRPLVSVYTVPTDAPEADGTLAWDTTTMVIAEVSTGEETGTGWTYGPAAVGDFLTEHLGPLVEGRDPLDIPALHDAMCRSVRNAGRPGIAAGAISALDIALWDLKARLLELPLARLLGVARERVPVYGSGGFTTYHDTHLAAQLNGWVHGQGIPRVKLKIGESWGRAVARDLSRVRTAREVIGPDAELYVDANGAYTRKQAVRVGGALVEEGVGWFEEPVSSDDLTGLRLVRDALVCDVTAGEYGYDLPYFARMIAAGAVDCLQIDATLPHCLKGVGGPPSAASRSSCARRPWPRRTAWRSRRTAPRTPTRRRPPRSPTSAIWSGSTTTSASRTCSSTGPSTRRAARSAHRRGWDTG